MYIFLLDLYISRQNSTSLVYQKTKEIYFSLKQTKDRRVPKKRTMEKTKENFRNFRKKEILHKFFHPSKGLKA